MQGLLDSPAQQETRPACQARPPWLRYAGRCLAYVFLALVLARLYHHTFGNNFHEVLPGRIYRSAQLSPSELKATTARYGIRTVVNLRGFATESPWYLEQCETVQELGIGQEDITLSAHRLPSAIELRRLIDVLDHAEPPLLLHCRHGADRTGVAAVVARFLYTSDTLEAGLRHLSWQYGHFPIAKTLYMDRFFDLYVKWLQAQGQDHSASVFRHWALCEYRGGWCQQAFESVEPLQASCKQGEPIGFRVQLRNISGRTWHFKPHESSGVHLCVEVLSPDNRPVRTVRAGLFEKQVPPGEVADLLVAIAPLLPGRYRVRMDMSEEGHCLFQQAGAEVWEEEIVVHE